LSCVWLYIVYSYNSIQHNGDVSHESHCQEISHLYVTQIFNLVHYSSSSVKHLTHNTSISTKVYSQLRAALVNLHKTHLYKQLTNEHITTHQLFFHS